MGKLLTILILILISVYWWKTQKLKEKAFFAAVKACKDAGVQFLDGTVAQKRLYLSRSHSGLFNLMREFHFEFTANGEYRYAGTVYTQGFWVVKIYMEPFHIS